jgi:hypothetical protein
MDIRKRARAIAVLAGTIAVLAGTQVAAQQGRERGPLSVTVTCQFTPLWLFVGSDNLPRKAGTPNAILGQRFEVIGGLRTTLGGYQYWQTNITVVESGYGSFGYGGSGYVGRDQSHYWISADCALPDRFVPR